MRAPSTILSLVVVSTGVVACSGGGSGFHCLAGDPHCRDPLTESFALRTVPFYQYGAKPIAVGASIDVDFQQQRCLENGSQSGPPPGSGCGIWAAPASISGSVQPFQLTNAPCPVTVVQTAPGRLHFTRTGPGDPALTAYGATSPGFCVVRVGTPETARTTGFTYDIFL